MEKLTWKGDDGIDLFDIGAVLFEGLVGNMAGTSLVSEVVRVNGVFTAGTQSSCTKV